MIKIAIDAMGGDFGPEPIVKGCLLALKERKLEPILVGKRDEILSLLPKGYKTKISIGFVSIDDFFVKVTNDAGDTILINKANVVTIRDGDF